MAVELIHGDCMEYMLNLIGGTHQGGKKYTPIFDVAIVDPPFGIGNFVQSSGTVRGEEVTWNDEIPNHFYFELLRAVSKHQIIFGANYYNQFDPKGGAIVWIKNQPMPNFSKAVIASCSFHKKIEVYTQTWTNFVNDRQTDHPCEMPRDIYKWIMKTYCKPGDKILDTHLGSGSSAIAAHDMGFDFVGCELDKDYYAAAVKRFNNAKMQGKLF